MKFFSQYGQDETVMKYYEHKKSGFFVEIGAFDGIHLSNTYALEKHGWTGICVEPLPQEYALLCKNRTSKNYNLAVDYESDKTLEFVVASVLSGDLSRLDTNRVEKSHGLETRIPVKTINFTHLLDDANAPRFIEYLSLDTEGSEYDILRGLDFTKYTFGYISVEHNYKEPARSNIRELLQENKYIHVRENNCDDDFAFK